VPLIGTIKAITISCYQKSRQTSTLILKESLIVTRNGDFPVVEFVDRYKQLASRISLKDFLSSSNLKLGDAG
jgi:hypothetical protein